MTKAEARKAKRRSKATRRKRQLRRSLKRMAPDPREEALEAWVDLVIRAEREISGR